MKAVFVFLALVAAAASAPVLSEQMAAEINANPQSTWAATTNNQFSTWTVEQTKAMLGLKIEDAQKESSTLTALAPHLLADVAALPTNFDGRTQWPNCIHPIRNQGKCGSCWAFSSTETLSDRFCIASEGKVNVVLSPEDLVACDHTCKFIVVGCDQGCKGGIPTNAWKYFQKTGVMADQCFGYKELTGDMGTKCPAKCDDGSEVKKYKAASSHTYKSADDMAADLVANGPITVGFVVYEDFMHYSSGVYKHTTGAQLGGHAVKIVGFGEENGEKYWLVANSWDTTWGLEGYFKIARGTDECHIETMASVSGLPQL